MREKYLVISSLKNIHMAKGKTNIDKRRLRSSNITVVVSIALVLFLIGITGLILINIQDYTNYLKEQYVVEIFLNDFVDKKDEAQVKQMQLDFKNEVSQMPFAKEVKYITKEEAFELAKKDLGPDRVNMIEDNIFPASLQVTLKSQYVDDEAEIGEIVKKLDNNPIVDEVKNDESLMVEVYKSIDKILMWLFGISILFLIIAIVLINNSIRLRIFSKRFIIKTMQLVGAKKTFIMGPFLKQAFVLGLIGALIAIIMLFTLWYNFTQNIAVPFIQDYTQYAWLALIILVTGIGITMISTYFAAGRFLRLRIDDLYYS